MIISLDEAKLINDKITQDELDAFESSVRNLTNNNFQNINVRFKGINFISSDSFIVNEEIIGLRVGDTLEVNNSLYNDGLYQVIQIDLNTIKVDYNGFYEVDSRQGMATLVKYPADVKVGIKKLIEYDKKMFSKMGIKSETISRMSTTYYDMNSNENIEGYPSSLLSFLKKYEKMRW